MNETKPIMKNELSTRARNVLIKTGLYSNSASLTAQKVIEYFNNGNKVKDCGHITIIELIEWAEKIVQNKTSEEMTYPQTKKGGDISGGLTKREWFAGMALQGLLGGRDGICEAKITAERAFAFADAMIAQSEVTK